MQTESYVVLRPFMVEELGLKGSELVAYALIYGFSQDGESWFTGSAQYVADWCVQNGVPEYVEADRLTREWVAAGGTERQFPRSRYPWNPRP